MKKQITKLFFFALITISSSACFAQTPPQAISYQAVARDNNGNILSNKTVSLRFSIHDSISTGTIVYQETQSATTNVLGLVNLSIGTGTVVSGTFAGINWGSNPKFLQVEIDPTGGSNYTTLGTSQMLSVPYALYAANGGGGGTTGQSVTEEYGTGSLDLTTANMNQFTLIPGLSDTVNVPANSKIIVRTEGAVGNNSGVASGYAAAAVGLFVDNNYIGEGGYRIIYVLNNQGIKDMYTNYAIEKTFDSAVIGPGQHVFSAQGLYIDSSTGTATVSSDNTTVLQGVITVIVIKE